LEELDWQREFHPVFPTAFAPFPIHSQVFFAVGSATVPVAVFGVAPKTRQPTDLPNAVLGATPETARETRALPNHLCKNVSARRRFFVRITGLTDIFRIAFCM
jgi:hypothetical protein